MENAARLIADYFIGRERGVIGVEVISDHKINRNFSSKNIFVALPDKIKPFRLETLKTATSSYIRIVKIVFE